MAWHEIPRFGGHPRVTCCNSSRKPEPSAVDTLNPENVGCRRNGAKAHSDFRSHGANLTSGCSPKRNRREETRQPTHWGRPRKENAIWHTHRRRLANEGHTMPLREMRRQIPGNSLYPASPRGLGKDDGYFKRFQRLFLMKCDSSIAAALMSQVPFRR
jgi:hypothetical protein